MSFFGECFIVFRRQLRMNLRNPVWAIIGLTQPILYLVLFGPLLKPLASQLGTTNAYALFVPGLLVQLGIFGSFFAGFSLISEWREGVVEAERVTPARRTALLFGRVMRDSVLLFAQGLLLIALALLFGMRGSIGGMFFGLLLTVLLGAACASASNALALTTKSEDVMAPVINSVAFPIVLLSGILLPMTLGPQWLQTLSDFVPTKHVVEGVRALFVSDLTGTTVLWGTVWTILLVSAGIFAGTRTFMKDDI